ncbi:MAG: SPOR domain-containing protein [Pseudomonadota bacterium]
MADNEDVNALRRRGRRRLIGAIALVLAAVIVLPMVFDAEPRQNPPLSVRIPGEDESVFAPKAAPKEPAESAPVIATAPQPSPAINPEPAVAPKQESAPPKQESAPAPEPKAQPQTPAKAEAATAGGAKFVVQIGAFREGGKVKEVADKLAAAKLPHYTEPVAIAAGTATRVRVGPYPSRQAAEQALRRLHELGFKGAKIVEQSS